MECWHLNFATLDRLPLFPTGEVGRRQALRRLGGLRALALLLFCIVDDHFHAVVRGSRAHAGKVVWRIKRSWSDLMGSPLSKGYFKRVEDRSHLRSLVRYHIQQPRIHGLAEHPALWSGSCFADLIGARRLPGLELEIHDALPRMDLADVFRAAELEPTIVPADDALVRQLGAGPLGDAASFALGVAPRLGGQDSAAMQARVAVAQLGMSCGVDRAAIASTLGCSARTLRRLASFPVMPEVQGAVRLRVALLATLAATEGARAAS